ncbi:MULTISPECIES: cupin domain-containing protein [Streptococcus]|uniref:Cupin domain-containing protein n=1 Tax=Streptococcus caledonicus TaxID=2614158 RepID=A0ABW0UEZ2_9STRE|nr:cupin domain-containing protein [Streptococcus sp. S784/96/1]
MHHHLDRPSKLHFHDYIEICYVASGRLIHIVDKDPFVMTAGDLIVIPEKKEHLLAPLE